MLHTKSFKSGMWEVLPLRTHGYCTINTHRLYAEALSGKVRDEQSFKWGFPCTMVQLGQEASSAVEADACDECWRGKARI